MLVPKPGALPGKEMPMADAQRNKTSAVKATTDLDGVKLVADTLLMMKVGKTDMSPIVVTHPFTSSGIVGVRGDQGMEVADILTSKDALKRWQECIREGIRTADKNGSNMLRRFL